MELAANHQELADQSNNQTVNLGSVIQGINEISEGFWQELNAEAENSTTPLWQLWR